MSRSSDLMEDGVWAWTGSEVMELYFIQNGYASKKLPSDSVQFRPDKSPQWVRVGDLPPEPMKEPTARGSVVIAACSANRHDHPHMRTLSDTWRCASYSGSLWWGALVTPRPITAQEAEDLNLVGRPITDDDVTRITDALNSTFSAFSATKVLTSQVWAALKYAGYEVHDA